MREKSALGRARNCRGTVDLGCRSRSRSGLSRPVSKPSAMAIRSTGTDTGHRPRRVLLWQSCSSAMSAGCRCCSPRPCRPGARACCHLRISVCQFKAGRLSIPTSRSLGMPWPNSTNSKPLPGLLPPSCGPRRPTRLARNPPSDGLARPPTSRLVIDPVSSSASRVYSAPGTDLTGRDSPARQAIARKIAYVRCRPTPANRPHRSPGIDRLRVLATKTLRGLRNDAVAATVTSKALRRPREPGRPYGIV